MKTKTLFLAAALMLAPAFAHAEVIKTDVNGLICAFCATAIEKTVGKIDGVDSVKVDLDARVVTTVTKGDIQVSDAALTKAIEDAGYVVVDIKRDAQAEESQADEPQAE